MRAGMPVACFSRRWCPAWSGGRGLQVENLFRNRDGELGEELFVGAGGGGELLERPGGSGEGAGVEPVQLAADDRPGAADGGLGDAGEQQGEPAEDDVGSDALLEPVIDRAPVADLLHVAPA